MRILGFRKRFHILVFATGCNMMDKLFKATHGAAMKTLRRRALSAAGPHLIEWRSWRRNVGP
jgi:hypothetical protein